MAAPVQAPEPTAGASRTDRVEQKLRERFPDAPFRRQEGEAVRDATLFVPRERIVEVCTFLRDDPDLAFTMLASVAGVDLLPQDPRFEVVYHLLSIPHNLRYVLKVQVAEADLRVPTVTGVWPTADWLERETFDFYGIVFEGHPDLTRILLPDDWVGWPLRKDSPLGYQEVSFTHNTRGRTVPAPDLTVLKPKKVRYRAH
ncbi:MAG TPA: NADH-quinone oxidoreductase subunit C [Candidatus Eisenbacteria bacterium]|nr:NADH-quinone oxidoreductase subunit C [Candidatus Eisenbacteria bacterium]